MRIAKPPAVDTVGGFGFVGISYLDCFVFLKSK